MTLCETCKHWDKADVDDTHVDIGTCRKVVFFGDAFNNRADGWKLDPKYKDCKAFALDGELYCAELITLNTFGCVDHEEKNT